jgi:hypothetical protein
VNLTVAVSWRRRFSFDDVESAIASRFCVPELRLLESSALQIFGELFWLPAGSPLSSAQFFHDAKRAAAVSWNDALHSHRSAIHVPIESSVSR